MKSVLIIFIALFITDFSNAQLDTENQLNYYGKLSKEANKEYPNSPYEVINIDSLYNAIFNERNAQLCMDTSSYWKVMFEMSSYSESSVREPHFINLSEIINVKTLSDTAEIIVKKTVIPQKNIKLFYDSSKVYYAKDLFLGLDMDSMFLNKNLNLHIWKHATDSLKNFPVIRERNDPLNREWVPIITDDYMILRIVHSYPDGNETSFYRENVIYFKKEIH